MFSALEVFRIVNHSFVEIYECSDWGVMSIRLITKTLGHSIYWIIEHFCRGGSDLKIANFSPLCDSWSSGALKHIHFQTQKVLCRHLYQQVAAAVERHQAENAR